MQAIRRVPMVWRSAVSTTRNYGKGSHKMPTLNDMPVPHGDFWALHAQRQRLHNGVLAAGVCSLSFALFLLHATDFKFYLSPPKSID